MRESGICLRCKVHSAKRFGAELPCTQQGTKVPVMHLDSAEKIKAKPRGRTASPDYELRTGWNSSEQKPLSVVAIRRWNAPVSRLSLMVSLFGANKGVIQSLALR